jgi:hypothetical protein
MAFHLCIADGGLYVMNHILGLPHIANGVQRIIRFDLASGRIVFDVSPSLRPATVG